MDPQVGICRKCLFPSSENGTGQVDGLHWAVVSQCPEELEGSSGTQG